MDRSIKTITEEIVKDWTKPYFGAVPYINAMKKLDKITDNFYQDSADSIVRYFLANAKTWRGETAKRIKIELNNLIK